MSTTQTKAPKAKKAKASAPKPEKVVEPEPAVVEPAESVESDLEGAPAEPEGTKRQKRFSALVQEVDELFSFLESQSSAANCPTGADLKLVKTLLKQVRKIRTLTYRICKKKTQTDKVVDRSNSGFMKPVQISKDIAKFTGWDVNTPRSRNEVTKFICQYIEDHNLQNPKNRRSILLDKKLSKLLNYSPESGEDVTYARVQTLLKTHYTPIPASK